MSRSAPGITCNTICRKPTTITAAQVVVASNENREGELGDARFTVRFCQRDGTMSLVFRVVTVLCVTAKCPVCLVFVLRRNPM